MLNKIKVIILNLILINLNLVAETIFIFNHGLESNKDQIRYYKLPNKLNWHILGEKAISFNFPDVNPDGSFNAENSNLAQDEDLKSLDLVYKSCLKDKSIDKIVLVGVSRGAAAALNYSARHPKRLAALVLESPFDCVENVIKYLLDQKYVGWLPGLKHVFHDFVKKMYKKYDKNGIQPIDLVKNLPKDLPVIFIHSKKDKLISIKSVRRLYKKLKLAGNKHSYMLELNEGEHGAYQLYSDANNYQAAVHAFLKKYNIEHKPDLALLGERLLENFQN